MENFAQLLVTPAAASLVLMASVIMLLASLLVIRRANRMQKQYRNTVDLLKRDMRALTKAAVRVGERVHHIEHQQRQQPQQKLVEQPKKVEVTYPERVYPMENLDRYEPANQPYEQAINMARHGAQGNEIANACGLSSNEAELIAMLHRYKTA